MTHQIPPPWPGNPEPTARPVATTMTPAALAVAVEKQEAGLSIIFNTETNPIDPMEPARFKSFGPMTRDEALMKHSELQKQLASLKSDELELRAGVAKILLRDPMAPPVKEGINNIPLGEGWIAKVGVKKNYTLISRDEKKDKLTAVDDVMDAMAKIGNEGSFIADRIFKFTVDISTGEYHKLEEAAKTSADSKKLLDLVNTVLEIKDATPTLEIKEPKAKK